MIISHKHKFIFIKTRKTAGSSFELMLSTICGPDDILTPLSPEEEEVRRALGGGTARNYFVPLGKYRNREYVRLMLKHDRVRFKEHWPAIYIRERVGAAVWNGYYKFAFDRNPFDKAVSYYHWKYAHYAHPEVEGFIKAGGLDSMSSYDLYSIGNRVVVDDVFKFEEMDKSLAILTKKLGLPEPLALPEYRAKSGFRKQAGYREVLTPAAVAELKVMFAREIAYLGYRF